MQKAVQSGDRFKKTANLAATVRPRPGEMNILSPLLGRGLI